MYKQGGEKGEATSTCTRHLQARNKLGDRPHNVFDCVHAHLVLVIRLLETTGASSWTQSKLTGCHRSPGMSLFEAPKMASISFPA